MFHMLTFILSHTCTHTYIHIYMHTYTYIYIHIHTYIHIHIHTYIYMHTYIHTYTYIHIYIHIIHMCVCARRILQILDQVIAYREGEPVSSLGGQYLANLYPNVSLEQLLQVQDLLNVSSPNSIWAIMRTVHMVAYNLSEALSRFDWDVFLPVDNETAMEHLFGDYEQQAELNITYLVAGLVFDTDLPHEPGNTFKYTTIKIRANFSNVIDASRYTDT